MSYKVLWPAGLPNRGPEPVSIKAFELRLIPGEPHTLPDTWPASRVVELLERVPQVQLKSSQEALLKNYQAELDAAKEQEAVAAQQAAQAAEKGNFLSELAKLRDPSPPPEAPKETAGTEPQDATPGASSLPVKPSKKRGGES